ncbi:SDR family NAD(P)-dependent oxidoreductase [Streptomyces antimycoticus]|uniref:SDR family oxidoreductase n=1 Tax=Streptomyces antimycoticus TaxID=68175 RepID=UPI00344AF201
MPYSLKDKRVLIVGGSSDIAAALATDLLQEGARVTLAGRNIEKTTVAAKAIGDAVRPMTLDLSDEESIQAAADQVRTAGGLDHLVSVATERSNGPVASLERRARCSRPSTPRSWVRSCWPSTSPS